MCLEKTGLAAANQQRLEQAIAIKQPAVIRRQQVRTRAIDPGFQCVVHGA
jgi:hypothetical protein